MEDIRKTKKQLINELSVLRQRVSDLEKSQFDHKFAKAFLKNSVPMAISTLKEGRYIDVSEAFLDLMGLERKDIIGNTSTGVGFINLEQRSIVLNELHAKGRVENLELQVRTKGNEVRYGLFNSTKITLAGEDHLLTVVTDITGRKFAEDTLRQKEGLLRGILTNLPAAMYQFYARNNGEMGLYFVSESVFELLGLESDPEDFFPRFASCVVPEDREAFLASIQKAVQAVSRWDHEVRFIKPTGEEIYIRGISQPRQMDNEIVFDGVMLDITDRRQAEEALRTSEAKYRQLYDNMMDAFVSVDMDGKIKEYNQAYSEHARL